MAASANDSQGLKIAVAAFVSLTVILAVTRMIPFELDTPHSSPANNPIASLVFSARGPDAHTVFVNGCEVVRNHKLVRLNDVKGLFARARTRLKRS